MKKSVADRIVCNWLFRLMDEKENVKKYVIGRAGKERNMKIKVKTYILLVLSGIILFICLWKTVIGITNLYQLEHPRVISDSSTANLKNNEIVQVEYYYAQNGYIGYGEWPDLRGKSVFALRLIEEGYVWTALMDMNVTWDFLPGVDVYMDCNNIKEYDVSEKKVLLAKIEKIPRFVKKSLYEKSELGEIPMTKENTDFDYFAIYIEPEVQRGKIYGTFTITAMALVFFLICYSAFLREKRAVEFWKAKKRREETINRNMALDKERWQKEREKRRQEAYTKWDGEL